METTEKKETSNFMKFLNSSFGKFLLIGFITLLLLPPLVRVFILIEERKERADEIKNEIRGEWGNDYHYKGIVMRIPLKKKSDSKTRYLFYFPGKETTNLNVQVNTKKRGIYHFPVFQCQNLVGSDFTPFLDNPDLDLTQVQIGLLAESDIQISNIEKIKINGKELEIEQEVLASPNSSELFFATAPFTIDKSTTQIHVNLSYSINCSGTIVIQGHAKKNLFFMNSNWLNPSFAHVLPNPNSLKLHNGFSADWNMMNIAQNPKNGLSEPHFYGRTEIASVNFLESVDHYQLNERTVKYAILVILLTFTVFYLIELIGKMSIHPVHYLMVGLSLILFYAILLSFSEQFGFAFSYLIASIGIVTLLSWYAYSVLRSLKFALTIFLSISLLYGFLYVIVNLETYALIVGSLGLFVVLAAIMSFTRRLKV